MEIQKNRLDRLKSAAEPCYFIKTEFYRTAILINAKYSQKHENEADDCGYDFLVKNGRNPWGMIMAFEKFLSLEGGSDQKASYITKMFSSHPETKARIERMTKRCNKDGIERPKKEVETK